MPRRSCLQYAAAALILAAAPSTLFAQWLDYPTPDVPRTPDGKPNLSAPAPRTADGKTDLSGMWGWETRVPCPGHGCTDSQIGREFLNIAYSLKGGLPYQPWAAELVKERKAQNAKDDPNIHCLPRGALRIHTESLKSKSRWTIRRRTQRRGPYSSTSPSCLIASCWIMSVWRTRRTLRTW